jgi:Kef-type K+ transport system membrane component KefB
MPDLALLLVQLVVVLAASRITGRVFRLFRQPAVVGEIVGGIALGPSGLGALAPRAMAALFPADAMTPLATLSQLGVILFMFVVGLRLDTRALRSGLGSAVLVSHASIVLPFIMGAGLAIWLHASLAPPEARFLPFVLFLGAAMSVTAFPVLARILIERKLIETRIGAITLASAAVDDVTAWCLLAAIVVVARSGDALLPLLTVVSALVIYAGLMLTIGRHCLRVWHAWRERRGPMSVHADTIGAMVLVAFASALMTEWIGVHALFGAFLAGAVMPRDKAFAQTIAAPIDQTVSTVLLPLFFAFTGLQTELQLISGGLWLVFGVILVVAVLGKMGGSALAARVTGAPWREALAIGALMNTRGLMELVILNVGLQIGVISRPLFAMMVLMALATTIMTSPLVETLLRHGKPARQPVPA